MPSLKREHDSGDAGRTPAGGLKRAKPNSPSKQDLRTRPQLISHAEDLADKLNDAKYQRKEIRMKLDASEAEASSLRGEVERKTEKISDLTLDKAALETKMKQSEKQSKDNAKFQADVIQKVSDHAYLQQHFADMRVEV